MIWAAVAVVAVALFVIGALRPFAAPTGADQPALQIAAQLRCPVCAGESAADSDTAQAQAMRAQIAADLQAGMGQRQILDQFVAQYGVWILYRPPTHGALALLWAVPALAVAGAGLTVWRSTAGRNRMSAGPRPADGGGEASAPDPAVVRRLGRFL